MKVEVVTNFDDFLSLECDWNGLLERSSHDTIFLRHEWFRCWWEAFGKGKQLFVLLIKDKGEIIGIAPLMKSKERFRGMPIRKIGFIKDDNAAHADFILAEKKKEVIGSIIQYLKENKNLWDMVILDSILKESDSYRVLHDVLENTDLFFNTKSEHSSPFISITSDWDTYFLNRSARFRKTLKNEINRINKLGSITIEEITNSNNLNSVLSEVFEVSARSWKGKEKSDISKSKENQRFFLTLSEAAVKKGWLSIWLLRVNGKAIAMEYHLKCKKRVYALRGDFDEEYRYFCPGAILDYNIVRNMFQNGVVEYDMCGGASEYKMKWTTTTKEHSVFNIFHDNFYSYNLYTFENRIITFLKRYKYIRRVKDFFYQSLEK